MKSCRTNGRGITLIEILVVVAIIGILISLLIPAVQLARESMRRRQCAENVRQIAAGFSNHEHAQGFLPSGGWGFLNVGLPDFGPGKEQPGSWTYQILPYIGLQALHDLGSDGDSTSEPTPAKLKASDERCATPVPIMNCPTRPKPLPPHRRKPLPPHIRGDYAACAGDQDPDTADWKKLQPKGGSVKTMSEAQARTKEGKWGDISDVATGVCYYRSEIRLADIADGQGSTYLVGEKYMDSSLYDELPHPDWGDDMPLYCGYDDDRCRWTHYVPNDPLSTFSPRRDQTGVAFGYNYFGSAHPSGFNMSFCDGSVHWIAWSIDPEIHQRLGNRKDGQAVDMTSF